MPVLKYIAYSFIASIVEHRSISSKISKVGHFSKNVFWEYFLEQAEFR